MAEQIFADGFIVKKPTDNQPDFVKANVAIKVEDFAKTVKEHQKDGWINIQVKEARSGNYYASIDKFEPKPQEPKQGNKKEDDEHDSLPF